MPTSTFLLPPTETPRRHPLRGSKSASDIHSPSSTPSPQQPRTHHPSLASLSPSRFLRKHKTIFPHLHLLSPPHGPHSADNSLDDATMVDTVSGIIPPPQFTVTPPSNRPTHARQHTPPQTPPSQRPASPASSKASQISVPDSDDSFSGLFYASPPSAHPQDPLSSSPFSFHSPYSLQRVQSNPDLFGPLLSDYHSQQPIDGRPVPFTTSTPPSASQESFTIARPGIPASYGGGSVTFPTRWEFPDSPTAIESRAGASYTIFEPDESTPRRKKVSSFTSGLRKLFPSTSPTADVDVERDAAVAATSASSSLGISPLKWGERVRRVSLGVDYEQPSVRTSSPVPSVSSSKRSSKGRPPPLQPAAMFPVRSSPLSSPSPILLIPPPAQVVDVFSANPAVDSFYGSPPLSSPLSRSVSPFRVPSPVNVSHESDTLLAPPPLLFSPPPTPPPPTHQPLQSPISLRPTSLARASSSASTVTITPRRRAPGGGGLFVPRRQPVLSIIEGSPAKTISTSVPTPSKRDADKENNDPLAVTDEIEGGGVTTPTPSPTKKNHNENRKSVQSQESQAARSRGSYQSTYSRRHRHQRSGSDPLSLSLASRRPSLDTNKSGEFVAVPPHSLSAGGRRGPQTFSWTSSTGPASGSGSVSGSGSGSRPASGSTSARYPSVSGVGGALPKRKSLQSVLRRLTDASRSSLTLDRDRTSPEHEMQKEIADEEFQSRSDTPTSMELRELKERTEEVEAEMVRRASIDEEEQARHGRITPVGRSTSISSRRELLLPRLVEARAMAQGEGSTSPNSAPLPPSSFSHPTSMNSGHLRRRSSASGNLLMTPSPSPHRTQYYSVPGRKVRIVTPRSPALSKSATSFEAQQQRPPWPSPSPSIGPRPFILQSSGLTNPRTAPSPPLFHSRTAAIHQPLLNIPASFGAVAISPLSDSASIILHPREALDTVLPAQVMFLLGFCLGPWAWLAGGWLLSPDGNTHSVDREGYVTEPSRYAKKRTGTSGGSLGSLPVLNNHTAGDPNEREHYASTSTRGRTRGESAGHGNVGDETYSTIRTSHSFASASLVLLALEAPASSPVLPEHVPHSKSGSWPALDHRRHQSTPILGDELGRWTSGQSASGLRSSSRGGQSAWSRSVPSILSDSPNVWVYRCRVAALISGGAIIIGAIIAVVYAARRRV